MNVKAFSFLQWAAESHSYYDELFSNLGLTKVGTNYNKDVIWNANDIYFFVTTLRHDFVTQHGPGVSGIGLHFDDAKVAYQESIENGMVPAQMMGHTGEGIDGVVLYFTDSLVCDILNFSNAPSVIDHITHNCHIGKDFNGEGVQHIALHTDDIYSTVKQLKTHGMKFLDIPDIYYDMIADRIDHHEEDIDALRELGILIDGSKEDGILLQIFTKEAVGPVFFEIIQRKGNTGFGHGNFKALFEAIERTQLNTV